MINKLWKMMLEENDKMKSKLSYYPKKILAHLIRDEGTGKFIFSGLPSPVYVDCFVCGNDLIAREKERIIQCKCVIDKYLDESCNVNDWIISPKADMAFYIAYDKELKSYILCSNNGDKFTINISDVNKFMSAIKSGSITKSDILNKVTFWSKLFR